MLFFLKICFSQHQFNYRCYKSFWHLIPSCQRVVNVYMQSFPIKMLIYIGACWPLNRIVRIFLLWLCFCFACVFLRVRVEGRGIRRKGRKKSTYRHLQHVVNNMHNYFATLQLLYTSAEPNSIGWCFGLYQSTLKENCSDNVTVHLGQLDIHRKKNRYIYIFNCCVAPLREWYDCVLH